jgi:flagellar biosynthesis activator protein FlaF
MQHGLLAYAATARSGLTGRQLEAAVLKHCALQLQRALTFGQEAPESFIAALERNRKAWSILSEELRDEGNLLPTDLRSALLRTAVAVFKRTEELANGADRSGAELLIAINRHLAAGLEGDPG